MARENTPRDERTRPDFVWPAVVPTDALVTVFNVKPEHGGMRLDRWLSTVMSRLSRTRAQRICEDFAYDPRGRLLRSSHRVRGDEKVVVFRPRWEEPAAPREVPVLYQDEHLIAVDKPAGLPVHPTARYHQNTLTTVLGEIFPGRRVVPCHRLDRETSGIVLTACTPAAERAIKTAFANRAVQKTYEALVHGVVPDESFVVDAPLALEGGEVSVRMTVRSVSRGGLPSLTRIRVLERMDGFTRVAAHPETGRQHQIRVHLAHAGFPIVGDKLYAHGSEVFLAVLADGMTDALRSQLLLERHALHAAGLRIAHPATGEELAIESPLPADLRTFCAAHRARP